MLMVQSQRICAHDVLICRYGDKYSDATIAEIMLGKAVLRSIFGQRHSNGSCFLLFFCLPNPPFGAQWLPRLATCTVYMPLIAPGSLFLLQDFHACQPPLDVVTSSRFGIHPLLPDYQFQELERWNRL